LEVVKTLHAGLLIAGYPNAHVDSNVDLSVAEVPAIDL
jgi:hypothetical protein